MLSICTAIYRETDSLEVFVRTVFGNASNPSEIEIIVANDEGYEPTKELLGRLSLEYPNLIYFSRTKQDRVKFLRKAVAFYRRNEIFTTEELQNMEDRILQYENGELESLWFPPGKLQNKASKMAHGDVLLFVPADYICFGDLTRIYEAYKKLPGDVVAHFDWLDTTSLDPMPDILNIVRSIKTRADFHSVTDEWLRQAFTNGVGHVWNQHGMRMVKREVFEKAKGFDGRWFTRSWNDDSLNKRIEQYADAHRLMELDQTKSFNPYFGTLRGKSWREPNYLCSLYSGLPEIHNGFLSRIQFYLEREGR